MPNAEIAADILSTHPRLSSKGKALLSATAALLLAALATSARAAEPAVTHVAANAWQSTDFHDAANPGCSIGGPGSAIGSRFIMGVSKSRPDPLNVVVRKAGWTIPAGTQVRVQVSFSDGTTMQLPGLGKGQVIDADVPAGQVRALVHELTSSTSMQLSFGGSEPPWTFDLAGTTTVVNAMGDCVHSHQIAGVGAPFELSALNGRNSVSLTQPFGDVTPPPIQVNGKTSVTLPTTPSPEQPVPTTPTDAASQAPAGTETVIAAWSGSSTMQTRPFHSTGPWELQWTTAGSYFSARLHRLSNADSSGQLLANGTEPGSSSFYQPSGGDFYLEFSASRQWTARAVAVPTTNGPQATIDASPSAPASVQSPSPDQDPYPAPRPLQVEPIHQREPTMATADGMASDEAAFIAAIQAARQQYKSAANDMAKGAARPVRAQAICRAVVSPAVSGWSGTVSDLTTNGDGKGVIAIRIAADVSLKTWSNSLSDIGDHTLIDPGSSLFQTAAGLRTGQKVRFSATLIPYPTDCYREGSLTMDGSIAEPEFIMRLTAIQAVKQ